MSDFVKTSEEVKFELGKDAWLNINLHRRDFRLYIYGYNLDLSGGNTTEIDKISDILAKTKELITKELKLDVQRPSN